MAAMVDLAFVIEDIHKLQLYSALITLGKVLELERKKPMGFR